MAGRYAAAVRRTEITVSEAESRILARLVAILADKGIADRDLLAAIAATPRDAFVAEAAGAALGRDRPLLLECGQTVEAPSAFARLCVAAEIDRGRRVLEIGTGSGWGTAVLAALAAKVYTVERWATLGAAAAERFSDFAFDNVVASVHDGLEGWSRHAPFDRILVSGATPEPPADLIAQLAVGGVLVAPLGPSGGPQTLTRWRRGDRAVEVEALGPVRCVALIPGRAQAL
ncbi:protein-L-isoaspartate(D-aspartate) O-methyltransferase [Siculibacillus lacustris]|uniref:Protein-L-isoaspartate O-methyltransferase n=1 Tax=Siculibacillus lacustris TaxID=1549641 RepID=A0A4Q9VQC8_9HYPH|nr:protein-L-isoaspartate(D-aspartate) O-methyltransferase [Siculibacillus lacustris]TBW38027.1 protein-L-isoaspartate(D-aspartate) O-methyltransferase [Siculibacillus lacustris]